MAKFTADEKEQLRQELETTVSKWDSTSRGNQLWDIRFKVIILLISVGIAVCSGLAATKLIENTQPWSVVATILAAVSSALSGFAFTQFNFATRQLVWKAKADEFRNLRYELLFLDPEKETWGRLKGTVERWNDNTPLEQLRLVDSREVSTS